MWHETTGVLHYGKEQWLVLDTDPQIGKYYRKLYEYKTNRCEKLLAPSWTDHITILRNEFPTKNQDKWALNEGKIVPLKYNSFVITSEKYSWLNVECEFALDLREFFGLSRNPEFPLHITISSGQT